MAAKANSKPCQTSEMELFPQVVTGFRGELRILPNMEQTMDTKMERFAEIVKTLLSQKPPAWLFDKVLNMLLNWRPKFRMLHF